MKRLLIFILILGSVLAWEIEILSDNSKYDNEDYIEFFQIPQSLISSIIPNGGERTKTTKISFVFDYSTSSWVSSGIQGQQYTNTLTNIGYDSLINNIIITFTKTVTINRLLYKTIANRKCAVGYPNILKLYYKNSDLNENLNSNENDFILFDSIISEPSSEKIIFHFSDSIQCNQIKIEWNEVNICTGKYEGNAVANRIQLFLPETKVLNEKIFEIYDKSDYRDLILNNTIVNKTFIQLLKNDLKKINFSEYATDYIKRIISIFEGNFTYDPRREFTTNQNLNYNKIYQRGNIANYAKKTLLMSEAGTNRQLTGIYARPKEKIIIYTKFNKGDKLPCIKFSQFLGNSSDWLGAQYCITKSKEIFTVNDFNVDSYKVKTNPGGPIYFLANLEEDSGEINIYIEGGIVYPIFKLNETNENDYMENLEKYLELYEINKDTYLDITEFYSKRVMISVKASRAYEIYKNRTKSPQKNLENWDNYLKKLYIYDGIQFDKNQPYYNKMNEYINIHIRYAQPYALAYAALEHIGIYYDDWVEQAIYMDEKTIGWGFPHEIGHMMDNEMRLAAETSNNMISKFSDIFISKDGNFGMDRITNKIKYLSPDNIENNMRGCESSQTYNCKGFFKNKELNYMIWWDLESMYPGYWGKLDNLYRYYNKTLIKGLKYNELLVYFSNIILGMDLGYYFTRWGLYLDYEVRAFDEKLVSDKYKELMQKAIEDGLVDTNIKKKFWYLDYNEYMYIINNGTGCYGQNDKNFNIKIEKIKEENGKLSIYLPKIECLGHLGFEIYENDQVIGFTYDEIFEDENKYEEGYIPEYYIVAYDRLLEASISSDKVKYIKDVEVY